MRKLYCDRCGKEVNYLQEIRIPDKSKPIKYGGYATKSVEVCGDCYAYVNKAVDEYNDSMTRVRVAFYETLFPGLMEGDENAN